MPCVAENPIARKGQRRRASVLLVPYHPAMIERWRSVGTLKLSDALGQHDFLGEDDEMYLTAWSMELSPNLGDERGQAAAA
jgi:hypothetical protein